MKRFGTSVPVDAGEPLGLHRPLDPTLQLDGLDRVRKRRPRGARTRRSKNRSMADSRLAWSVGGV